MKKILVVILAIMLSCFVIGSVGAEENKIIELHLRNTERWGHLKVTCFGGKQLALIDNMGAKYVSAWVEIKTKPKEVDGYIYDTTRIHYAFNLVEVDEGDTYLGIKYQILDEVLYNGKNKVNNGEEIHSPFNSLMWKVLNPGDLDCQIRNALSEALFGVYY